MKSTICSIEDKNIRKRIIHVMVVVVVVVLVVTDIVVTVVELVTTIPVVVRLGIVVCMLTV